MAPLPSSDPTRRRRFNESEDRPRSRKARLYSILAVASAVVYLALLPGSLNPVAPGVGAAFLAAELACLALFLLTAINVWSMRFKPRSGLTASKPHSIDVFITVCNEPPEAVERALASAARLQWSGPIKVYVLDDGGDSHVADRAGELGLTYLSRFNDAPPEGGKAGNLNYGLRHSTGELVFVLDADHVVQSDAIEPMAGYMKFGKVAFVQSKQAFLVSDGDPFNSEDPVFYDAVQLGFDADDSVLSCGSGVLYRRSALEEIGGFAEWNLVEDLTTSYELHSRGWKSLYFPYAVTSGLAPANIREVYQQRGQWATDTMRIFFWDNPVLKKGLGWASRLNHLMIGLSYLWAGFFVPIFFLIPIWTYLTGTPLLVEDEIAIVLVRVLYFLFFAAAAQYLLRGSRPGKQFQFLAGLFPVYVWGTVRALLHPPGRKPKYRVNNAPEQSTSALSLWIAVVPQMTIFLANLLLPFYAIIATVANPWVIVANVLVSAFALWTLWPVILEGIRHRSDSLSLTGLGRYEVA